MKIAALIILLLIASVSHAAAPSTVAVNTNKPLAIAYEVVNGNVVRCFAEGDFNLMPFAGSTAQPPKIIVNGRWGHKFSVIDFAPADAGASVSVKLVYAMGRTKRAAAWTQALNDWLGTAPSDYCPAMP